MRFKLFALLFGLMAFGSNFRLALGQDESADEPLPNADESLVQNVNLENWELILGFIQPIIADLILQSHWSAKLQACVAFVITLVTTFIGLYFQGGFDFTDWMGSALKVFAITIPAYYGFWRNVAPNLKASTDINALKPNNA